MPIMNSSTSSSDAGAAAFLRSFVAVAAVAIVAVAALLLLVDPYDTGRLTPFARQGMPETAPRTASASRVRDPAFDAAIVGNSTIQLVRPEKLKELSGLSFVQLSVPGTGPMEQATLIERLFALRGAAVRALVVGLDYAWCDGSRETRTIHPFPFWLHDPSDLTYARSLFRMSSVEYLPGRIRVLLGDKRTARRDGFWDFELLWPPHWEARADLPSMRGPPVPDIRPADGGIARILAAMPAGVRLILVYPPVHISRHVPFGDDERRRINACKAGLNAAAARRPGVEIVDLWVDDADTRNPALFFDASHYRRPLGDRIEAAIAEALRRAK